MEILCELEAFENEEKIIKAKVPIADMLWDFKLKIKEVNDKHSMYHDGKISLNHIYKQKYHMNIPRNYHFDTVELENIVKQLTRYAKRYVMYNVENRKFINKDRAPDLDLSSQIYKVISPGLYYKLETEYMLAGDMYRINKINRDIIYLYKISYDLANGGEYDLFLYVSNFKKEKGTIEDDHKEEPVKQLPDFEDTFVDKEDNKNDNDTVDTVPYNDEFDMPVTFKISIENNVKVLAVLEKNNWFVKKALYKTFKEIEPNTYIILETTDLDEDYVTPEEINAKTNNFLDQVQKGLNIAKDVYQNYSKEFKALVSPDGIAEL